MKFGFCIMADIDEIGFFSLSSCSVASVYAGFFGSLNNNRVIASK